MAEWTQCPNCKLKHQARPDGFCPRCRQPIAGGWGAGPATSFPPAPSPGGWAPPAPPPGGYAPPAPPQYGGGGYSPPPPQPPAFPPAPQYGGGYPPPYAAPYGMAMAPNAFTVGGFIGGTFTTWWRSAGAIVLVALLANTPLAMGMYFFYSNLLLRGREVSDPSALLGASAGFIGLMLLSSFVINPLETAAVTRAGVQRAQGAPVELGDMVGTAFRRFFPVFGLSFLVGLVVLLTFWTLLIVPLILLTGWAASLPAVVTEGLGPIEAMKRSWDLTRGLKWQVFAGFLVVVLIIWAASCLIGFVLNMVVFGAAMGAGAVRADPDLVMEGMPMLQATNILLYGIYGSFLSVATAVAYQQLRVATEGPAASRLGEVFN